MVSSVSEPVAQRPVGQVGTFVVAEPVCVDDRSGWAVDANGYAVGNGHGVSSEVECVSREAVPAGWSRGCGPASAAGEGGVDLGWDLVGESVACESRGEAESGSTIA